MLTIGKTRKFQLRACTRCHGVPTSTRAGTSPNGAASSAVARCSDRRSGVSPQRRPWSPNRGVMPTAERVRTMTVLPKMSRLPRLGSNRKARPPPPEPRAQAEVPSGRHPIPGHSRRPTSVPGGTRRFPSQLSKR